MGKKTGYKDVSHYMDHLDWSEDIPEVGDINLQLGSLKWLICRHLHKMAYQVFCHLISVQSLKTT